MAVTEYRGVEGLVYAEVTQDDLEAYVTGEVKMLAPVSEISRTTESSSETHYYDNAPAVIISTAGADEITCAVSAIPLDVLADITGQTYDATLGAFMEGQRVNKYFALGYATKKTDGSKVYVWRYKGTFSIPDSTHVTENDGTDANGQEIVYTGIETTHKFSSIGKGLKALNIEVGANTLADVSAFFETVTTPDTLKPKA